MTEQTVPTKLSAGKRGSKARDAYLASFRRQYHPPSTGLHVCGFNDDLPHGPHFTVLALPLNAGVARAAFMRAKVLFSVPRGDHDVIVDLFIDSDSAGDFWMRRQMVEPMQRSITDAE